MKKLFPVILSLVGTLVTSVPAAAADMVVKSKNAMPPPQLGISPPRVEKKLAVSQGKRLDQSLVLYNYNDKPKTVALSLHDISKDKKLLKPSKTSLSPWAIINPTQFVIPAKGQQTVRISIRPPMAFPKGTHYAMLQIQHKVKNPLKYDKEGKSVTVSLGSSYGLPIIITTK